MRFTESPIKGAYLIDLELKSDDRGFFSRSFCTEEFRAHGLNPNVVQCNTAFNHRRGTLRGLHYQLPPAAESKVVRCTRGAIHDVIVDLRPHSPTYLKHFAVELTADNRRALYVPPLFAHGYLTLTDNTELTYQVSEAYTPGCERGLRYNDPALNIDWPLPIEVISPKDTTWPDLHPVKQHELTPA